MFVLTALCCAHGPHAHSHGHSQDLVCTLTSSLNLAPALLCLILAALSSAPLGVFLVLRRMTLTADALGHGMMPGSALGAWLWPNKPWIMSLLGGGIGMSVAGAIWALARYTALPIDSASSGVMLCAMAVGMWALTGLAGNHDPILMGNLTSCDWTHVAGAALVAGMTQGFLWRCRDSLLLAAFDPVSNRLMNPSHWKVDLAFLAVLMLNLMLGAQVLGGFLGLALLILPGLATIVEARTLDNKLFYHGAGWGLWGAVGGVTLAWPNLQRTGSTLTLCLGLTAALLWSLRGRQGVPGH